MNREKESNFVSAVVYLHDNAGQISPFLERVYDELEQHFKQFEIIMVNDASRDSSVEEIRRFMSQKGRTMPLTIVNMSLYQGVELCMNAGLDLSIGDFIFEFDSLALSYPEGQIFEAYCTALTGYDIVSVRPRRSRSFTSRLFYGVFNRFSGSNYKIGTDIFRVLSRRALNRVHAISTTPAYRKAAYAASGLKLYAIELPGTAAGTDTNQPLRLSLAVNSLVLYTDVAYRVCAGISLLMLLCTLADLAYTLVVFLGGGHPIEGWTTTMLVISVGFFGVFLILALVLKYLSLVVDLIFRQQKYLVEGIEKL